MTEHQGHSATITLSAPESGDTHAGNSQQDSSMNGRQQQQEPNQAAPPARGANHSPESKETDSMMNSIAAPQAMGGSQATNRVRLSVMA
jgi:hypothetical protein